MYVYFSPQLEKSRTSTGISINSTAIRRGFTTHSSLIFLSVDPLYTSQPRMLRRKILVIENRGNRLTRFTRKMADKSGVCVQLIADVRELHKLELLQLTQQLLKVHHNVLLEMQKRQAAGSYIAAYNRAAESLDERAVDCRSSVSQVKRMA